MEFYNYKKENKLKKRLLIIGASTGTTALVAFLTICLINNVIRLKDNEIIGQEADSVALSTYGSILNYLNSSEIVNTDTNKATIIHSFSYYENENKVSYCAGNNETCYIQDIVFEERLAIEDALSWFAKHPSFSLDGVENITTYKYKATATPQEDRTKTGVDKNITYIVSDQPVKMFTSGTIIEKSQIFSYTNLECTNTSYGVLREEKNKFKVNSNNLVVNKFYKLLINK